MYFRWLLVVMRNHCFLLRSFIPGLIDKKLKETIKHTQYSYVTYKYTCLFKHFLLISIYLSSQAASRYVSFITGSKTICSCFNTKFYDNGT
jgi:hypothetical protein